MTDYLDVLVLCSDPVNLSPTLNLAQELVQFERIFHDSQLPIRLRRVFPPTLAQLRKEFAQAKALNRQPSIFHFLGHGDDDGLYFEDEHGESQLVKGHELKSVLAQSPVKLVLLNACWSATKRGVSLIDFLTREQVADAAISHQRPVADVSAIEFAKQFYTLLTEGRTIEAACQRAANSLAEQGKSGATEVKLVGSGDVVLTDGLASGERPCVIESGIPTRGHLPDASVFFGRGEEIVQISRSFVDVSLSGFGLWGIGGIGKTALAKAVARRNAWRYEGAVWVDIRETTQKTTTELLRLALCRLHPGSPDSDPVFELSRRLQAMPSLVVLDNLEDLPQSEHAALARFIQQLPKNGSRVLLTARVPLADIERLPEVQSRRMTVGLDSWNGAHYVQHVARQKQCLALKHELRLEGAKLEGLCVHVSRRLHGHPKMLELAVGVALKGRDKLEQALVALPEDIEQQLAAMLATSLQFLGENGNLVLPLLCFFPTGSLTPEALDVVGIRTTPHVATEHASADQSPTPSDEQELDEVKDDSEPDLAWLHQGREQLVAAGLLDYDQAGDVYTFHQSIMDEAHRRRPRDEMRGAVTAHLLMHYAKYVVANHANNVQLDRCFENILVLMESLWSCREANSPIDGLLADMSEKLGSYFQDRGLWRVGTLWHERAIEIHRSPDHAGNESSLAYELYQLGHLLKSQGDLVAARVVLHEALGLNEQSGNQQGIGASLRELASIESAQGNPSEARRLHQRSMAIFESLRYQRGLSASLHQLANIEVSAGNRSEARQLWERSIGIDESLGDIAGAATTKCMLAQLEAMEGQFERAIELAEQGVRELEKLGYASAERARDILRKIQQAAT